MNSLFFRKTLIIGSMALSLGVFVFIANASHSWGGYHWARTGSPFTLKLGDNVSGAWDFHLATTSRDWSASATLISTVIVPGLTNATKGKNTPKQCVPTLGRVEVCNAKYGANGWLGVAQIWVSGTHITQGTAKMNDTYFNTASYNTAAWKNLVMCQEVAHTFGLSHQDEIFNNANLGTCMDYTNSPAGGMYGGFDYGPSNEHPDFHDYEELGIIYSHLDTTTTLKATASSVGDHTGVSADDPSGWGKEIRKDSRGHGSLFERDLGGGHKVFTFVIWTQ